MERREFLHSTGLLAAATVGLLPAESKESKAQNASASSQTNAAAAPSDRWSERKPKGEPHVRRWNEQRWILDNIIQANGIDWDQGHTGGLLRSCGLVISGDIAGIKQRAKRFAAIGTAFEVVARKREAEAEKAAASGDTISARDNYYIAAQFYGQAMWTIYEVNDHLHALNQKKRDTFGNYMKLADHRIEWVEIPYRGAHLPAVFHLPPDYKPGTKVPVIVAVPGMDGFKEKYVSLYGDAILSRGFGILSVEGPGYWEAPLRGLFIDVAGWQEASHEVMKWLRARPEVDSDKLGMTGSSYGSFFSAVMLAAESNYKFCIVHGTCYEPGGDTIFNTASVTFKKRFMFMSGITDEHEFDEFAKTLDWHGLAEKVTTPYLVVAGSADQLCPTRFTEAFLDALAGPKQLLLYQDADHGVGGSTAVTAGPNQEEFIRDWMKNRLDGKPLDNERWFVDVYGKVTKTPI
ncbi:MAG TPA: prolyl oligopeptidase family serine peptidase [Beijerinckiaceae bacterium]|nr:prolyl oligopeptidase family serine peptidase [Beijerinckiaceae bacterium]